MKHARQDYDRIQDPLGKIGADEPVFLLRAQDKSAPDVVRYWADENVRNDGELALSELAERWADKMEEWQRANSCKPADMPANAVGAPVQAQPSHDCTRSHPHEEMSGDCIAKTEQARIANAKARESGRAQGVAPPNVRVDMDRYDAGLLSDFGGGNVAWWQDYLRAELERADEFYQEQHADLLAQAQPASARADQPAAAVSIVDDAEFENLIDKHNIAVGYCSVSSSYNAIVAYVDAHCAQQVARTEAARKEAFDRAIELRRENAALRAQLAARGEPVVEIRLSSPNESGERFAVVNTLGDFDLEHFQDGTKLYTAPQPSAATITLTGNELRQALDLINPDGPGDELQCCDELTFGVRQHRDDDNKVSTGMCCWNDDTDGVLPLTDEWIAPQPSAQPAPDAAPAAEESDGAIYARVSRATAPADLLAAGDVHMDGISSLGEAWDAMKAVAPTPPAIRESRTTDTPTMYCPKCGIDRLQQGCERADCAVAGVAYGAPNA